MTQLKTYKPTAKLLHSEVLRAMTGFAGFLGGASTVTREKKFVEATKKVVNARLKKVGKALPGLRIPEDAFGDQFNAALKVMTGLDALADAQGRFRLDGEQHRMLLDTLTKTLLAQYVGDGSREAQ